MRVLIVGGGLGGLAAALAIRRRRPGDEIVLAERAGSFGEVGAGIQLSPNATRVLQRLGLGDALAEAGFRPEAVEVRDAASGGLLLRTPLGAAAEARWGAPYWHVHRADLHALLVRALSESSGIELRLGAVVEAVDPGGADRPATARFAGGGAIEADVLVGADGWRSTVREGLFGDGRPRFTGQTAWRGLVPAAALPEPPPPVAAVWTGPGRHFVHYYVRGGTLVNFVAVTEGLAAPESWRERGDRAELAAAFAGWPAGVRALIAAAPETWRWGLYDRPPAEGWSRGRATLAGDAAHPMAPFLAQGAAMAFEDACALAGRLGEGGPVASSLLAYQRDRMARTARVQAESRRNGVLFHLPGAIRRAVFAAARRLDGSSGAARLDWLYGFGR